MAQTIFGIGVTYTLVVVVLLIYIVHLENRDRITKSHKRLIIADIYALPYLVVLLTIPFGLDSSKGIIGFLLFWTAIIVLSVIGFDIVFFTQKIRGIV